MDILACQISGDVRGIPTQAPMSNQEMSLCHLEEGNPKVQEGNAVNTTCHTTIQADNNFFFIVISPPALCCTDNLLPMYANSFLDPGLLYFFKFFLF